MKPYEIKKNLDETVIAYIEGKIGIGEATSKLIPFVNTENFNALEKAGFGHASSILERITDSDFYLKEGSFEKVENAVKKYYEEIKR